MNALEERACTCCGVDPLAVACEALVVRALEVLGKRMIRSARGPQRSTYHSGERAWHEAYLFVPPSAKDLDGALASAWEHVPHLCARWGHPNPDELTRQLDSYVRQLVAYQQAPSLAQLHVLLRSTINA